MKLKRYFWNMKHHKELDKKMGLARKMSEPMARLAEACGMDTYWEGTKGLQYIGLDTLLYGSDKVMPDKMKPLIEYDFFSKETPHRFHRIPLSKN